MISVFNALSESGFRSSFPKLNELLFDNEEFSWIFRFNSNKVDEENTFKPIDANFLKNIGYEDLTEVKIVSYEYIGWRDDITKSNPPTSLCFKLYLYLSIINLYHKDAVTNNKLELIYGNDYFFCDTEPNYAFEINIHNVLFEDIEFYSYCNSKLKVDHSNLIPHRTYWYFYKEKKSLKDDHLISILNTNTKARRLGYFKLIASLLSRGEKISANYIFKKFENYSREFIDQLERYKNTKGLIQETKTGISARPYIMLAKELGFLNIINNVYSIGKQFKVYLILANEIKSENKNIFILSKLDKLFFLESILTNDFLYVTSIIEIIYVKKETNYSELIKDFQKYVLKKLDEFATRLAQNNDIKAERKIKAISNRIKKWEKPEVYLEHVLMPRLNWLLDLELIEMDPDLNIKINSKGTKFFSHLCYWNDINCEKIINARQFLETFIIRLFNNTYYNDVGENEELKIDDLYLIIDKLIEQSFDKFRTLAPNRVTSSQAINYTRYKLYFDYNVVVSTSFIEGHLKDKDQNKFVFKFQSQYNDGYIQMRR